MSFYSLLLFETVQETGPHLTERLAFAMRRARMVEAAEASARRGSGRAQEAGGGNTSATAGGANRQRERKSIKANCCHLQRTSPLASLSEKGREQRAQHVRGRRIHTGGGHSVSAGAAGKSTRAAPKEPVNRCVRTRCLQIPNFFCTMSTFLRNYYPKLSC